MQQTVVLPVKEGWMMNMIVERAGGDISKAFYIKKDVLVGLHPFTMIATPLVPGHYKILYVVINRGGGIFELLGCPCVTIFFLRAYHPVNHDFSNFDIEDAQKTFFSVVTRNCVNERRCKSLITACTKCRPFDAVNPQSFVCGIDCQRQIMEGWKSGSPKILQRADDYNPGNSKWFKNELAKNKIFVEKLMAKRDADSGEETALEDIPFAEAALPLTYEEIVSRIVPEEHPDPLFEDLTYMNTVLSD